MAKYLFWLWVIALLILNVMPMSSRTNANLSCNRVVFRLDYLVHMITFVAFAWAFVLGQVTKRPVFEKHSLLKYVSVVILSSIGFELVQLLIPSRAFNPMDLMFNLFGVFLGLVFVGFSRRFSQKHSAE